MLYHNKILKSDWLTFEKMIFIRFLKLLVESRFKFVGTAFPVNLEATYAKVNVPVLSLLLVDENCP